MPPVQARQNFNLFDRCIRLFRTRRIQSCLSATDVVLDFGCGQENWFLRSSSKAFAKGIGIDPNLRSDFDHGLQGKNVQAKRCTIEEFAKTTSTRFDVITWLAVIEHFHDDDAESMLKICTSLLKPGGKLVLTTPTPSSKPILEFLAFKLHMISEDEIRDHKVYYNKMKITSTLQRSGLSIIKYKTFQFGLNSLVVASPIET